MTTRVRLRDNPTTVTLLWMIGVVTLAGSAAVAITLGPAGLSVGEVASIVVGHLGGTAANVTPIRDGIVWDLRLPRTLLAALCGAGLGLCGAIMQSLLRNPLADPFVLGISSGASTGAVLIVILGVGSGVIGLSSGAFIGAVISFALVLLLAHAAGGTPDRVILAGVAATQLFSALTSFIVITSADPEQTPRRDVLAPGLTRRRRLARRRTLRCGGRSRPRGLSDSLPRTRRLCLRRGRRRRRWG